MKDQLYKFYILHQRKYKESSLLVSIFTKEFGKLSAILRTNKKTINLYQPLVELKGQIGFAKKDSGLNKIYDVELVSSHYHNSYMNLLSLQYMNELIYLLLSYSHEELLLFEKYDFILKNINGDNYRYMLRMFELELLESLGQGVYIENDTDNLPIEDNSIYTISTLGFRKVNEISEGCIRGKSLLKINESMSLWSSEDLVCISRVTRVYIDHVLAGKSLKSRKLLVDYLSLKK